jgi:hypothetical protein
MQSRAVTVVGAGGRLRPMFIGQWHDSNGVLHRAGMADLLLTPRIRLEDSQGDDWVTTVLWVECKSGTGKLNAEQEMFRDDVTEAGAFYIECRDSADSVIRWFEAYDVRRR